MENSTLNTNIFLLYLIKHNHLFCHYILLLVRYIKIYRLDILCIIKTFYIIPSAMNCYSNLNNIIILFENSMELYFLINVIKLKYKKKLFNLKF